MLQQGDPVRVMFAHAVFASLSVVTTRLQNLDVAGKQKSRQRSDDSHGHCFGLEQVTIVRAAIHLALSSFFRDTFL